ncbi:MAG: Glucose-6-phosphate 1-dehydrogenase, partial [uncultured Actinomycetospora sp.]
EPTVGHRGARPGARRLGQPAARRPRQATAAHRGTVRPGALRGHRRPGAQEAHAGDLRPGQPRPAPARLRAGRVRPARLGGPGLRRGRPRRGAVALAHPVPPGGVGTALGGPALRAGHVRRRRVVRPARRVHRRARRRARDGRQPRVLPVDPAVGVPDRVQAALALGSRRRRGRGVAPRGDREAVRPRPALGAGAQRDRQRRLPRGLGLPDRPLPRQGDRPEPARTAVRQRAVRADLERPPRRPRADHDGRGHRRRGPRGLLRRHRRGARRHPEPPAAAPRADGDGGAGLLLPRRPARGEDQGPVGGQAGRAAGRDHRARAVRRGVAGLDRGEGPAAGGGLPHRLRHRDLRGDHLRGEHPPLGRRPVLPAHRQASRPARHRDRRRVQAGAAPAVRPDDDRGAGPERPGRARAARRGRHAAVRVEGAGLGHGGPRRHDGLRLRHGVHRGLPRGLRAPAARRPAGRAVALPHQHRGRAVLAHPRPGDREVAPRGLAGQLPRRHLGSALGRRPARAHRTRLAAPM